MYYLIVLSKNGKWMLHSKHENSIDVEKYYNYLKLSKERICYVDYKILKKKDIINFGELGWQRNVRFVQKSVDI